ncbi:MAG: aminoacetone oxidase family FAD-binding enzyme [Cycloclasticus sp.]|nr:aminoacetone oxidase family FAD-binding enzyme [Cycloclasticus sp.]MBG96804.1 aminoacetone oxidase family FAD-binding enzyme [Cycloclasticus sp.]HAI95831.1 aminoacetone oxidase family FAD-binding enzyme [Methylococcaceae bacterium]
MNTLKDVIIIGASASGLMCAIEAGKRGRKVLVLDHANKAGKKILMSGGGRCNFTNMAVDADHYISNNPHFCKSALSRYTQWDFISLVSDYNIPYHERQHGQLFCDESSKDILDMLLSECTHAGVDIQLNCSINQIHKDHTTYHLDTTLGHYAAHSLVIATGGLSIPKMGATGFGYQIAKQFGHTVQPTRAGLVPFTLQEKEKTWLADLSGIAIHCLVSNQRNRFKENMLLTHRGLSGPAILQISSYWRAGETITINLIPDIDLQTLFKEKQEAQPKTQLKALLADFLPKRFISALLGNAVVLQPLQSISFERFKVIAKQLQQWQIKPNNTEGYRTAEVTLGGVDCNELSSQTMESKHSSGLYFIGEVVDVTGWLGGYNFQWAWSSGWCAGQVV